MNDNNLKKSKRKDERAFAFAVAGCILCVLSMLPFFILGERSIITYNDQLDGELITYILNAKHLFEGREYYPELMNGIPVAGMISPAPLFVLLFKIFKPFTAFMIMTAVCRISAFLSIYLLNNKLNGKYLIGFALGLAFMMLPFYPVYGLCIPGQAFVWLAVFTLLEDNPSKKGSIISVVLILFYSMTSSLALTGFAIIILLTAICIFYLFRSRIKALRIFAIGIIMITVYALCNMPLVRQLINTGSDFVSHKSETLIVGKTFADIINGYLFGGDPYTACAQKMIITFTVISLVFSLIVKLTYKREKIKDDLFKKLLFPALVILIIIGLIMLYNIPFVVLLRNDSSGMLHEFNFERISWTLPVIWMMLLMNSIDLFSESIRVLLKGNKKRSFGVIPLIPGLIVSAIIFMIAGFNNDSKLSLMRLLKGKEYQQISFGQFYSKELFDEAEKIIGRPKDEYKVISMGLLPASATYNGFYCLDAYSNNYDVNYKHEFREIIENELAKSDYYTSYYDDWGNRCYIYLSAYKTGINASFYNIVFKDIDIDFKKAGEMGAEYVFSASAIEGYANRGLTLLNETPVRSEDCWYELYIYRID